MKVLHITAWYPDERNPKKAIWIKRLIDALSDTGTDNDVMVLDVAKGSWTWSSTRSVEGERRMYIRIPLPWRAVERLASRLLKKVLKEKDLGKAYDLINIHIAYPNALGLIDMKDQISSPLVISEHWSAYHFDFHVDDPHKLDHVRAIFQQGYPLITVSDALGKDIVEFSGNAHFDRYRVPNVVDDSVFKYHGSTPRDRTWFMLSQWKAPKDPFTVLEVFADLIKKEEHQLRIGGYGEQEQAIKETISKLGINDSVAWLGMMNSEEIAVEMNRATAFIHMSDYETFSVVCAEALCCGCPVIASNVGGIPEFVNGSNGVLLEDHSQKTLKESIARVASRSFDRMEIATQAQQKFSSVSVGARYRKVLEQVIKEYERS